VLVFCDRGPSEFNKPIDARGNSTVRLGRKLKLLLVGCPARLTSAPHGQPQRQLAIPADMAINEVFQFERHRAILKPEAAQDFLRDGLRHILG
jgi:hypothetical protein